MDRIARTTVAGNPGQVRAAVIHDRRQHLAHRMAVSGPQIIGGETASVGQQLTEGGQMSLGQV